MSEVAKTNQSQELTPAGIKVFIFGVSTILVSTAAFIVSSFFFENVYALGFGALANGAALFSLPKFMLRADRKYKALAESKRATALEGGKTDE